MRKTSEDNFFKKYVKVQGEMNNQKSRTLSQILAVFIEKRETDMVKCVCVGQYVTLCTLAFAKLYTFQEQK